MCLRGRSQPRVMQMYVPPSNLPPKLCPDSFHTPRIEPTTSTTISTGTTGPENSTIANRAGTGPPVLRLDPQPRLGGYTKGKKSKAES